MIAVTRHVSGAHDVCCTELDILDAGAPLKYVCPVKNKTVVIHVPEEKPQIVPGRPLGSLLVKRR